MLATERQSYIYSGAWGLGLGTAFFFARVRRWVGSAHFARSAVLRRWVGSAHAVHVRRSQDLMLSLTRKILVTALPCRVKFFLRRVFVFATNTTRANVVCKVASPLNKVSEPGTSVPGLLYSIKVCIGYREILRWIKRPKSCGCNRLNVGDISVDYGHQIH